MGFTGAGMGLGLLHLHETIPLPTGYRFLSYLAFKTIIKSSKSIKK
jgi:hypothetical protein